MSISPKITVVCTANVCRSPMAEALLRHALKAEKAPLNSIEVQSAGVSAGNGDSVTPNSAVVLKDVGIKIPNHQSQRLTQEHIDNSLLVLGMTQSHIDLIQLLYENWENKLFLFREMGDLENPEIPDPYGMPVNAYRACRDSMVEAIPGLLQYIRSKEKEWFK